MPSFKGWRYFADKDGNQLPAIAEGDKVPYTDAIEINGVPTTGIDKADLEKLVWIPTVFPNFEKFRADVEGDNSISPGKRLELLLIYELMVNLKTVDFATKIQAYWQGIKSDPVYDWLDEETIAKVEAHAAANKIPLVAK